MKISVATTTIHDCSAQLRWLNACDPDVPVYVALDEKTPPIHDSLAKTLAGDNYKCSDLLGWNTIERRNVAILEALRDKADVIVLWDDDNIPLMGFYFDEFRNAFFAEGMHGKLSLTSPTGWFDPGSLLQPPVRHRGFPHQVASAYDIGPPSDLKVGLAGGIVLGDPDIGAVERIAKAPIAHGFSELLRQGVIVDNKTWTITNSQNTAVLRQFVPCMLTCPQFGRYADIMASLICQRVMREHGYAVHLGLPAVWQQRNKHDLVKDLRDEMFGMQHILSFANALDMWTLVEGATVLEHVASCYDALYRYWKPFPKSVTDLVCAWCDDCESVL